MVEFNEMLVLPHEGAVIPTEDSLRAFVKMALYRRGLTCCQMARELEGGPCEKQLYRWLGGKNSMGYTNIEKIIKYLIKKDEDRADKIIGGMARKEKMNGNGTNSQ